MLSALQKITNVKKSSSERRSESGNVLFLILIAVALFAALSYAVTQSSRSGSGDASSETNLISSAALTQYPASIRTAIIRMIVSSGADVTALQFDPPADFAATGGCTAVPDNCVFHPSGGGGTYANAPGDVMEAGGSNTDGVWSYNADFEIINLGISSTGTGGEEGNEVIAFLPGIKQSVCTKLNESLNFGTTPVITTTIAGADPATAGYLRNLDVALDMSAAGNIVLGTGGSAGSDIANFDGQPFGCFRNTASGDHVYYHVLVER
jgi:hypothetical protein